MRLSRVTEGGENPIWSQEKVAMGREWKSLQQKTMKFRVMEVFLTLESTALI
jgi:hypothetical protein